VNAFDPGAMTGTGFAAPSGNALARGAARVIGGVMGKPIGKQSRSAKSGADLAALVTDPALQRHDRQVLRPRRGNTARRSRSGTSGR